MSPSCTNRQPPPERTAWPGMFMPAADLLEWLAKQRPLTQEGKKRIITLRWLVLSELDRTSADTHHSPHFQFSADDRPGA